MQSKEGKARLHSTFEALAAPHMCQGIWYMALSGEAASQDEEHMLKNRAEARPSEHRPSLVRLARLCQRAAEG